MKAAKATGPAHKLRVVALIERDSGVARSMPANSLVRDEVAQIVRANVAKEANLTTDESRLYSAVGREYAAHEFITHGRHKYVRGEVSTNTVEGFFPIFKRGMRGIYQHCHENHLHRHLAEFDFRSSNRAALSCNDAERPCHGSWYRWQASYLSNSYREGLMPTNSKPESEAEQSERFRREAQRLIDAGELNPTETDEAVDLLVRRFL